MVVHELEDPIRSIAHLTHRLRLLHPPRVDFPQGGLLKLPRPARARKVRQLTAMHHLCSSLLHWLIDHPQRHCLDLFPLSSQRRFRHLHPREKGQLAAGGAKGHPGAQAHHALFQPWGKRHFGSQP